MTTVTSVAAADLALKRRTALARAATLLVVVSIWLVPVPEGLTLPAWRLFALFIGAIFSVIVGALPILTASILSVSLAVLSGTLTPAKAYAGFANPTILLIVVAFLVARAVVSCGLGARLGHLVVSVFGRSTLGLSYSIFVVDGLIAPAFPSSTARGGVLYPLVYSLAVAAGAKPGEGGRPRLGAFLMFSGMASLSLSSALWFTAMAGNPLGAEIAQTFGVNINFGTWLLAASVPTIAAMALLPLLLYRLTSPDVSATPGAPAAARAALAALGPFGRNEKIVTATFVGMVALWAAAGSLGLDSTAVAFLGLGILLATRVLTPGDIAKEGDVLATFIWFAVLYTLSGQLNELGFMAYLGLRFAGALGGLPWVAVYLILAVAYVLLHYLFVSQTAHILALFGVFMDVGVKLGVPAMPLAFLLLFASDFFSVITPQGSAANLLFVDSGYLPQKDAYRLGAIATAFCLVVYLVVGTPWLLLLAP
ncbi:MAG: DASS family sodium-coupled anion symporter [Acidobacteria bacterium]|nr:MAG: DASS family sodium-coupled anion symporter [Acidobacteriota bacterium]